MRPLLWTSLLASVTVTGGCKKEKPFAPTEMTEILTFMFENFDDPESMGAASDNLKPWLDDNADTEEIINGYQMNPLTEKVASAVDYPPNAVLSDQLGAVTGNLSSYPLDDQAIVMVQNDQSFLNTDSYIKYKRDVSGNVNQFKSGSGLIETDNDVETKIAGIITIYTKSRAQFRWVQLEDGSDVFLHRTWITRPATSSPDILTVNEQLYFGITIPWEGHALRLGTTWAEAEITGGIIGEDGALQLMVDNMAKEAEILDEYLD